MPYIKQEDRDDLDGCLNALGRKSFIGNVGELNYAITKLCLGYLGPQPRYIDFNDVLGVLTAVTQELYRRKVAPYEDKKIIENGDVYE